MKSRKSCAPQASLTGGMLDEPTPFDTLEVWEAYRRSLEAFADDEPTKAYCLERAAEMIAEKEVGSVVACPLKLDECIKSVLPRMPNV